MKVPTYIPSKEKRMAGSDLSQPVIGSKKGKIKYTNNSAHIIHPDSDFVKYPEGELNVDKELSKIKSAKEDVQELTGEEFVIEGDEVRKLGSEQEKKEALAYLWIQLRNTLLDDIQDDEKQEALNRGS